MHHRTPPGPPARWGPRIAARERLSPGGAGMLYGGAEGCRYFKSQQGSRRAAVAPYSQAAPAVYARLLTRGLRAEVCAATLPRRHFGLSNSTAPVGPLCRRRPTWSPTGWTRTAILAGQGRGRGRNALRREGHQCAERELRRGRGLRAPGTAAAGSERPAVTAGGLDGGLVFPRSGSPVPGVDSRLCGGLSGAEEALHRARAAAARDLRAAPVVGAERRTCLSVARWRDGTAWVAQGRAGPQLLHCAAAWLPPPAPGLRAVGPLGRPANGRTPAGVPRSRSRCPITSATRW